MSCLDEALIHALLDGALPPDAARTTERHISECAACRDARDAAADLRDAATGLLAQAAVPPRRMPTFAALQMRAAAASRATELVAGSLAAQTSGAPVNRPPQHRRLALQAAGVAAAACLGWLAYGRTDASTLAGVPESTAPSAPSYEANAAVPSATPVRRPTFARRDSAPRAPRTAALLLPVSTFARTGSSAPDSVPHNDSDHPPPQVDAPSVPPVRITALEPGASAGTMRVDTDFRLSEASEDEDIFANLEFPEFREPVRSPIPSALLRVRAVSNAVDTLGGRSFLRRRP